MSDKCPWCGAEKRYESNTNIYYKCGSGFIKGADFFHRSDDLPTQCYEAQVTTLQARVQELEDSIRTTIKDKIRHEWPDCGKPYYYCELCGESSPNSRTARPEDVKHEPDCLHLVAHTLGITTE